MVSSNFVEMTLFLRHLGIFYMPQSCDVGQTALARNFSPEKSKGFDQV
jgi:hypothetical protein